MAAVKDIVRYRSQACAAPAQRRQRWTPPALKSGYIHILASDCGDGWYGDADHGHPYDIDSMAFNDDSVTLQATKLGEGEASEATISGTLVCDNWRSERPNF